MFWPVGEGKGMGDGADAGIGKSWITRVLRRWWRILRLIVRLRDGV